MGAGLPGTFTGMMYESTNLDAFFLALGGL
jgi:hypothetical protein